jgi:hypothetical protein
VRKTSNFVDNIWVESIKLDIEHLDGWTEIIIIIFLFVSVKDLVKQSLNRFAAW